MMTVCTFLRGCLVKLVVAGALLNQASATDAIKPTFDVAATRQFLDQMAESVQLPDLDVHWPEAGKTMWYAENHHGVTQAIWQVVLTTPVSRNPLANLDLVRELIGQHLALGYSPGIRVLDYDFDTQQLTVSFGDRRYEVEINSRQVREIPLSNTARFDQIGVARNQFPIQYAIREEQSADGRWILTLSNHDVALRDAQTGQLTQATDTGTEDVPWYFAPDIMEPAGPAFSPNSAKVALRTHDQTKVTAWPIVDWLSLHPETKDFRYWAKAGQQIPITQFCVYDVLSRSLTPVSVGGGKDHYAVFLGWSPDSSEIWFYRATRDFRQLTLWAADAESGEARKVLTESRSDGYVEFPWNGIRNLRFIPGSSDFLWYSDRSGWSHWYRYRRDGELIGPVTQGEWVAGDIARISDDGQFWFSAQPDANRPYNRHLLKGQLGRRGKPVTLTRGPGLHNAELSSDGTWLIDTVHGLGIPPRIELRAADGTGEPLVLATATIDSLRDDWSEPEPFVVMASDGETPMHGVLFKPFGFDPGNSYPVIERIYGGPQSQVLGRGYFGFQSTYPGAEYQLMLAALARAGFVVVAMDAPGTPGRGREYNMRGVPSWPKGVVADHVAGLKALAADRPWMDLNRLGIDGNSWGGYMALRSGIEAPEFYRAISASVPENNFHDHAAWIEMVVGSPADNPDAYAAGNLLNQLDQLVSPLLLVMGTSDGNVGFSTHAKLLDGLAEAGKPYQLVLFPGTNHAHQGRGDRYAYAVTAITQFFYRQLGRAQ
ncbi:MAG: DPP IV N-terminal domain-containing protein [Pseudomonadota bacterium]